MYAKNVSAVIKEALEDAGANFVFEKPSKLSDYKEVLTRALRTENGENGRKSNTK